MPKLNKLRERGLPLTERRILKTMLSMGKRTYWGKVFIRHKRSLLMVAAALAASTLPIMMAQTPGGLRGDAILDHLNAVIDWYRHALTRVPTVGLPSDAVY